MHFICYYVILIYLMLWRRYFNFQFYGEIKFEISHHRYFIKYHWKGWFRGFINYIYIILLILLFKLKISAKSKILDIFDELTVNTLQDRYNYTNIIDFEKCQFIAICLMKLPKKDYHGILMKMKVCHWK